MRFLKIVLALAILCFPVLGCGEGGETVTLSDEERALAEQIRQNKPSISELTTKKKE